MILCCGEALIDMIPAPTVSGALGYVPHAGGAVFNTAIALGRLGADVGMLTGLSSDLFGQQLRDGLTGSGVDLSLIIRRDAPTTLAFVQLEDGQASYTFYDENTAGRSLTQDALPTLPADVSTLFFGGISLCSEPAAEAYRALAERAAEDHVIMIDPNIRPGFIRDEPRYRARLTGMIELADIVKVSGEDLDWLLPGPETPLEKATSLLDKGPAIVVLTQGGDGATAICRNGQSVHVPAAKATVIDTVAAGDTFNAAFLAHLDRLALLAKKTLPDIGLDQIQAALEFGAKAAAITVSRTGANPPWNTEI